MRALAAGSWILLCACAGGSRPAHESLHDLRAGLSSAEAPVRARAAWELGQLGMAEVPESGESAQSVSVREQAVQDLVPAVLDPEASVRRAAVEALGKVAGKDAEETILTAGTDIDPAVRGETALALFRRRYLKRVPEYSTAAVNRLALLAADPDAGVRWKAVYAFTRFPDPRAEAPLTKAQKDSDATVRLFAARAAAKAGRAADASLLKDSDQYVRAEAVASFGSAKRAGELPSWIFDDKSAHVLAAAADAGAGGSGLERLADSGGPMPRGRALIALAKQRGESEAPRLAAARKDPHWWVRSKAYEASAVLRDGPAILDEGVSDPDARVASQALETLAASTSPLAAAAIERALRDPKSALELLGTAIDAAAEKKSPAFAEALKLAAQRKDLTAEIGESLVKALKASGSPVKSAGPPLDEPKTFPPLSGPATIVMTTERGTVELELASDAAPNHAAAIAANVRSGLYDGTIWHRVVTAFVVQGGDPRGSGWGDSGYRLRDEINRLPFTRGTLGMPKAGPDTGGCQLFVSLVPTPHLDGRYTAFGRVTAGMDVLDALQPGDKIINARLR